MNLYDLENSKNSRKKIAEAGYGQNRGYAQGFASPTAPSLGSVARSSEGESEYDDKMRKLTGMIFYNVNDPEMASALGLKQTRTGKWFLRTGNRNAQQAADREFGQGKVWYPKNESAAGISKEKETEFHSKLDTLVHDTFGKREGEVAEGEEMGTFAALKGLKTWQVVIMNNYYRGKYSDYSGRYYYVLATSPEEAKQVVLDNADAILQELLAMKSQNGKKILPRGTAVRITPERINGIKDGTEAGRMSTAGFKKMFGPEGPMMVKLSSGAVVDMQDPVVQGSDLKTVAKADLGQNRLNLPSGYGDVVQPQKLEGVAEEKKQVTELDKKTLASYAKKAANSMDTHAYHAYRHQDDSDYDKKEKRKQGIGKAVDRLAKEQGGGEGQLNEYLLKAGMPVKDVLALNLFQDFDPAEGAAAQFAEFAEEPMWQQVVRKYAPIANMLKKKLLAQKRPLTDAEAEAVEQTWYDGSDAYDDMEIEYLVDIYNQQIDTLEALLAGNLTDEEFGEGVAEGANVNSQIKRVKDRILQLKDWNTAGTHDKKIKELQAKLKELQSQKQGVTEAAKGILHRVRYQCDDPSGAGIASGHITLHAPDKTAAARYATSDLSKKGKKNVKVLAVTPQQQGVAEDNNGFDTHIVMVTVSDPNATAVTQRGETVQKRARVRANDRETAINIAINHYKKAGYKVQDHHYVGAIRSGATPRNEDNGLNELSNELLGRYKKELGVRASAADKAGDYDKGHEYFKKINKATIRQGENDARKHEREEQNEMMETRLNMMRKAGYDL